MLVEIIIATLLVSLVSFVGILFLSDSVKKYLHYLISFAAATLLSVAFFDLLPSSLEELEVAGVDLHVGLMIVLAGIILFFIIERFIHWHHCDTCTHDFHEDHHHHETAAHKHTHKHKAAGFLVLAGDSFHNFIDGIVIAGAFLLDATTGVITTLSIFAHEIPQEIGDFTVLLHSGFTKKKALLYNFYSALASVVGGVVGYFALSSVEFIVPYVVAMAAGGFVYIALTHIVPALHNHKNNKNTIAIETAIFFCTLILFYVLLSGHTH